MSIAVCLIHSDARHTLTMSELADGGVRGHQATDSAHRAYRSNPAADRSCGALPRGRRALHIDAVVGPPSDRLPCQRHVVEIGLLPFPIRSQTAGPEGSTIRERGGNPNAGEQARRLERDNSVSRRAGPRYACRRRLVLTTACR